MLKANSLIYKEINEILIQNQIQTKQFKVIMELNSIEAIKTAVSLGLGAAFVLASALEKLALKQLKLSPLKILK